MASEIIRCKIDKDLIQTVRGRHPDLDLEKYLVDQIKALIGVPLKCHMCGYSWTYMGKAYRIKCNRCGHHLKTGIRPPRIG